MVTAVNGVAVHTASDFVAAIHAAQPGETVQAHRAAGRHRRQAPDRDAVRHVDAGPRRSAASRPTRDQPFLGVASTTQTVFVFPFQVSIDVGAIGGPSAGLALTLGLLDVLSAGNLTGGHRIAATGTINLDGTVGDVGGVAQKAVAVRQAGAQVFFVPPDELKDAQSQAGSMKVYAGLEPAAGPQRPEGLGRPYPDAGGEHLAGPPAAPAARSRATGHRPPPGHPGSRLIWHGC